MAAEKSQNRIVRIEDLSTHQPSTSPIVTFGIARGASYAQNPSDGITALQDIPQAFFTSPSTRTMILGRYDGGVNRNDIFTALLASSDMKEPVYLAGRLDLDAMNNQVFLFDAIKFESYKFGNNTLFEYFPEYKLWKFPYER